MSLGTAVLLSSIVLQVVAAALALRLIRITGWRAAWLLFAAAILLMAFRRAIAVWRNIADPAYSPDLSAELVALLISVLILAGVIMIGRTFRTMQENRQALTEAETRVSSLMNHVSDGIVTIDRDGIVESFSMGAERIFGYTAAEVLGRSIGMLMPESDRARHQSYIRRYLETGKAAIIGRGVRELLARRKDDTHVPIELTLGEMLTARGPLFIGVVRDISERKAQEAQLQQAQKMEAVGQLTGGLAHDFNNLLTVILGNLDLLKAHVEADARVGPLAAAAERAARRGADLTKRLLAFSRRQALKPAPTDINRMIPETVELVRRTIGAHIEIETVLGAGLWSAMVDRTQLESAVLNLAINARDAMGSGGKLTIETANAVLDDSYAAAHIEVTPGRYVMVAVSDTGCGMAPEVVARAFEPFFTTKETGQGTGLGLSMIYGFVKQSGGHVKIYSEPEIGTTVRIYLPRAPGAAAGDAAGRTVRRSIPVGSETILIVEDDADVRAFVVAALADLGFHIHQAADGPSAMAMLDSIGNLDMLFTDVVLPGGMNGREVADAIRRRQPDVCVLYTSGYTRNAVVHQGRLDPDVDLLAKPFTRETLVTRVRARLDARRAGRPII